MVNKDIYKIWAPPQKKWVDWVRPVPFFAISNNIKKSTHFKPVLPCLSFLEKNKKFLKSICAIWYKSVFLL